MTSPRPSRSKRQIAVMRALDMQGQITEAFASAARCSLAEAVVELLRLEREGIAQRGNGWQGMTWRAAR